MSRGSDKEDAVEDEGGDHEEIKTGEETYISVDLVLDMKVTLTEG